MLRYGMRGAAKWAGQAATLPQIHHSQLPRHLARSCSPIQSRAFGSLVIGATQSGSGVAALAEGEEGTESPLLADLCQFTTTMTTMVHFCKDYIGFQPAAGR